MDAPKDFLSMSPEEWEAVREDIAFARALRNMEVVTTAGSIQIQFERGSRNAILDLRKLTASGAPDNTQIPAQSGSPYDVLTTDGTSMAWQSPARFFTGMRRTASQSIPDSTFTSVSFDVVELNTFAAWAASAPTKIHILADGLYLIASALVYANNTSGVRYASVVRNGSGQHQMLDNRAANQGGGGNPVYATVPTINTLTQGEYLELQAYQDSGGALNISGSAGFSYLRVVRIGDIPA